MKDYSHYIGKKFNRLTIIKIANKNKYGLQFVVCKCNCGNIKEVYISELKRTKSCGCLRKEIGRKNLVKFITKHNGSKTRLYKIWSAINDRCNRKKAHNYKYYGGRGIKCEWTSFEDFRKDMNESYIEHFKQFGSTNTTIDRIDVNGNYCKENCKWATRKEQYHNRRKYA